MAKRTYTIIDRPDMNPRHERTVFILLPTGPTVPINPKREIEHYTHVWLKDRIGCVVGMADGFQSAGVQIAMRTNRNGILKCEFHRQCHPSVPIYWFLGYALAQSRWEHIKRVIQMIPWDKRFDIYEDSALEFMGRRLGQQADLIAPVGLLVR